MNIKHTLGLALMAVSFGTLAQTPAQELVKNNPMTQMERGWTIDTYGDYTILGSKFGPNGENGAGMLFLNNQFIRNYKLSTVSDGVGYPGNTVSIDQHALVVSAPNHSANGVTIGRVGIAPKTWDGTHYSTSFSQILTEGSGTTTGFGQAVSISDNFIAVGAAAKGFDGGVRMYYRNPSTAVWEDKGWLTAPNFDVATYRFPYNNSYKASASFGSNVSILHNNMIVSAPGLGTFYIYEFNGTTWTNVYTYTGPKFMTGPITISDEHAAIGTGLEVEVYKKQGTWIPYQTITVEHSPATALATDNNKLIIGQGNYNNNEGRVNYYEPRSYALPGTNTWVYNFLRVGRMYVSISASPNALLSHNMLGQSVAIHGSKVVAGAPNARYTGFGDGAGFRADFSQMLPVSAGGREADIEAQAGQLSLFPNPAIDKVTVSGKEVVSATATNALGATFNLSVNGAQIDISSLASGIYSVTIVSADGTYTQNLSVR